MADDFVPGDLVLHRQANLLGEVIAVLPNDPWSLQVLTTKGRREAWHPNAVVLKVRYIDEERRLAIDFDNP